MDTTVFTYFRGFLSSSSIIPFSSWQLHVAPIEYLVNWGILGALGLVLLVVGAIHMWYRLFFHTSSPDKILATASFIGIILYTGFWSDWSLHLFAICVSLSLLGGTLHFLYRRHFQPSAQRSPGDSKIFAGLWMTLLGLCIYVSYKDLRGRYFFRKGIQSYELSMAEKYVSKALTYDSQNYHYYNQLGNVFLRWAPYSELIRRKALAFFRKSLEINPYQLYPYENLGALYTFEKRYGLAYEYYFRAIYLNPARSLAYIQLVDILYRNHFDDLADRWTALACFLQPELIQTEPMADGFLKRAPVREYFFALLRRAQKDVAEGRITTLTEEDLELREFIFKTLLHQKHPLLKTLSGDNLPPRKKGLKKTMTRLFKDINLSTSSLEHVHEKCAAGYIPFGNGLFYPEDHILYATVEKVRMHNLDGPTLHLCSPRSLYWHPLLSKYVPYLRFHYGNPYARLLPREAYQNPFEEDDLEEIKSLPF
jgi:tetratricopeptide (TPR) repeat protein